MLKPMNPLSVSYDLKKGAQRLLKSKTFLTVCGVLVITTVAYASNTVPEFTNESQALQETVKGPIMKGVLVAGTVAAVAISIFKNTWWPTLTAGGLALLGKSLMKWIQAT